MTQDLQGKVAVVTGAARGIGAASARALLAAGANVVAGDIDADGLAALADEFGDRVSTHVVDISTEAGVKTLIDDAAATFGRLDILHSNAAGIVPEDTDILTATDDAWRATFDFAVMAAVWGARHAVPLMKQTGGGSIINMSSGAAKFATAAKPAYASCKAAIETLTLYTGAQCGTDGVRCNALRPGFVLTEGIRSLFNEEQLAGVAAQSALGRICTPEDIADAVVWLASDASGYVNGQVLAIDGGGVKPSIAW